MKKEFKLGALINQEDNRDIPVSAVAQAMGIDVTTHPKKNITDISMLPVENQLANGSCVGQAEGKDAEFQNYLETGKMTRLSKRALYALCKAEDGYPGEGTYPRIAAKIRVSTGVPKESLVKDDNSLPHAKYIDVKLTNEIKTDASETRSKGYSFVYTLDELKTAIDLTKAFNATLFVGDWSKLPVKPRNPDGSNRGSHRIWIFGYEDAKNGNINDTKVYYLNSWGINWATGTNTEDRNLLKKGVGYFWWSEYVGFVVDMIVYLDMPNEIIDYAKSQQFIFPRQLERGMKGTDVIELQKRLDKEIAVDGKKCYLGSYYDVSYGPITEKSVQRYQIANGLVSSGTPATTGFGRVGPKTLAHLNKPKTEKPDDEVSQEIVQKKTPHFTKGRGSYKPEVIVIHIMDGSLAGTDSWFASSGSQVSSHYGIGKTGEIHQYVKESDQAWHAGKVASPSFKLYKKGVNPNLYTIGIEHEGEPLVSDKWSDPMKQASARLIADICKRNGIPLDRDHVIGHYEINSEKPNCPALNRGIIDELVALALKINASEEAPTISMNNITQSATKLVLLYIVLILGLMTAFAVVWGIVTNSVNELTMAILASFSGIVGVVVGHYFNKPGDPTLPGGGK